MNNPITSLGRGRPGRAPWVWAGPLAAVLACFLFLTGCGVPVPEERRDYVGLWRSPHMILLIQPDGRVHYERVGKGAHTKINAPIQAFEGNDFVVGFWLIRTTFVVQRPPYLEGFEWKMVVEGVELTRVSSPAGLGEGQDVSI